MSTQVSALIKNPKACASHNAFYEYAKDLIIFIKKFNLSTLMCFYRKKNSNFLLKHVLARKWKEKTQTDVTKNDYKGLLLGSIFLKTQLLKV